MTSNMQPKFAPRLWKRNILVATMTAAMVLLTCALRPLAFVFGRSSLSTCYRFPARIRSICAGAGGLPVRSDRSPWDVLGLPPPNPKGRKELLLADVRRAFRNEAKSVHPDVPGGSAEDFKLLVWAYSEVVTRGADAGTRAPFSSETPPGDDFLNDAVKDNVNIPGFGSLFNIELDTDDDNWLGRAALINFFVRRHDALYEGRVKEQQLAIYRLMHPVKGRAWGVGKVVAVQATWSTRNTPPGGRVFLNPLRMKDAGTLDESNPLHLVEDDCAEVAVCRLLDRFELLEEGVTFDGHGYTVTCRSRSHARLVSDLVHVAQCSFEEECEVKAEECIYCYGDECDVQY